MRIKLMLPIVIVAMTGLLTGVCAADQAVLLQFKPEAEQKWQEKLIGELTNIMMAGQPLGVTGNAGSDVHMATKVGEEGAETSTVVMKFENLKAELNREKRNPSQVSAIELKIEPSGKIVAVKSADQDKPDLMNQGGIPVQFLAILAHLVNFPENEVTVEQEWQSSEKFNVPIFGEVPINSNWKLSELKDDNIAVLGSLHAAVLPPFEMPSPFGGGNLQVAGAQVLVTGLVQEFDMELSRVISAKGILQLNANVDMQGMVMPVQMNMKFEMSPVEEEPAAAEG